MMLLRVVLQQDCAFVDMLLGCTDYLWRKTCFWLAQMTHFYSPGLCLTYEAQQPPESYIPPDREVD